MEICDTCKEIEICSCGNFCLAPDGGITAGEDYIITIIDRFQIKYTQTITATVYGTLCVDITGFPGGFFSPWGGRKILSVALASSPDVVNQVVYNSISYTCISLAVKECASTTSSVVIPPSDDCDPVCTVTGNIVDNTDPNNPVVDGLASQDNISELFNDAGYITTAVQSVVAGNAINVDSSDPLNPIVHGLTIPIQNGLLSGGRVTWIVNYDYEVSAAVYAIGGIVYSSPLTTITLDPADLLLDRIDTFALTDSGTAIAITGTPSVPPVLEPDVDVSTQLRIAFAYITANTTEPTLSTEYIYLENTEWTTAVSAGTLNTNSANFPYSGTVDIEGTAVANNQFITFTPVLFPSLLLLDSFEFKIRNKAAWNNPSRLVFRFQNGTTNVGNAVTLGNGAYGFVSATTGVYQNINIPLSDFGNIAAATRLRIQKSGGGTIGFYIDQIRLVGNNNVVIIPAPAPTTRIYKALLNQQGQQDGLLTIGVEYTIVSYQAGDDFTNVGGTNVTGNVFIASGTTPTDWTNFSFLTNNLAPTVSIIENTLGNVVFTRNSNGQYIGTLAGAFPQTRTWYSITKSDIYQYMAFWGDVNTVFFSTNIPSIQGIVPNDPLQYVSQDGLMFYTPIEIQVRI